MKRILSILALAALTTTGMNAQDNTDVYLNDEESTQDGGAYQEDTRRIFLYSPNPNAGLHIAFFGNGQWNEMGQLCSSDYGAWGAEKRMYKPSVVRVADGTWRAVWQLNDHTPAFAAAYSRDLITWRPQDYPRMSTSQCLEPILFDTGNTADIYYKSREGKRYVSASADFRHFTPDEETNIDDAAWLPDTALIGGKVYEGCHFEVKPEELMAVARHMDAQREDYQKSTERMHDDATKLSHLKAPVKATLTIDMNRRKAISNKLIGIFFEDISYAADGGLYAEMVQNRDFEYTAKDHQGWNATTAWNQTGGPRIDTRQPLSAMNPHYVLLKADTLYNEGWDGMAVEAGKKYDLTMYVRLCAPGKKTFVVSLITPEGKIIASAKLKTQGETWTQYGVTLTAKHSEPKARLVIVGQKDIEAAADMISLFPQETFMNRKNGLRRDLAQVIADLKPKFVRFPGGCMSHGQGLGNIYHWNETVGPLQDRKPDFNIWGYHQTRGLGFFEYFQFCEDIGAEPLPVLAAGVPCQNSANDASGFGGQQGGIPMDQMPAYIQELLNLIDWANGDPQTSKWAKMRADAGHPEPFHLKYIGIGNEDIISTVFEERYEMICKAIRQKYPDIKICGTVGPFHTPSADYIEGWDFTKKHPDLQYMVDEHYYESTGWFLHHRDYYDSYDRKAAKVYLGEYAASTKVKRPNVETALSEAIYLTDIERNGDVVEMTSYAPMLCKDGHSNWNPDMIYFSNTAVRTTPAYDVQRLFSIGSGNQYVHSQLTSDQPEWQHRLAASVVVDSTTGRRYLKLVNALPVELNLSLQGITLPEGAQAEGFEGKPEDQHPACQRTTLPGGQQLTLPPYSFRLIEL
jgi:alpha-L-arabinofuranosidase